ncbi:MAG: ABC transporter substrate-binding protein [Campylobacterota bacterium]
MNRFLKILVVALLTFNIANALQKENIKETMEKKVDKAIALLKDENMPKEQRAKELFRLFDEIFDYELMAKISLGKSAWVSATKQQQERYLNLFEKRLKDSYLDKLELYNNQDINIVDLVPYKNTRLQLQTKIVAKDETYKVNYNFYNKNNNWLIYDVDLLGVSIIKTHKSQFEGILKNKTFDELLKLLEEKNIIDD